MKLDLPDMLARLASGDFAALDDIEARFGVSPEARKRRELATADAEQIAREAGQIGDRFLQWLLDQTWGRLTFDVMSHPDPQVAHQYGVFREGQNALASAILALVQKGRRVEQLHLNAKGNSDGRPTATATAAATKHAVQARRAARPSRRRQRS